MRLESAVFASREGLNSHGQAIAVVGDNISNANTTGYKTSRVEFSDLLSGGMDADLNACIDGGGGNGARVSAIKQLHEVGVIEQTNRGLDAGIEGGGFFIATDGERQYYTRAGNFIIDEGGYLSTAAGLNVLGYAPGTNTGLITLNMVKLESTGAPTTNVEVVGNLDSRSTAGPDQMLDVLAPEELRQRADYTTELRVYDSLGTPHNLVLAFKKTGLGTWSTRVYAKGEEVAGKNPGTWVEIGDPKTLEFPSTGVMSDAQKDAAVVTCNPTWLNGAAAKDFTINLGGYSQFAAVSITNSINSDGRGSGNISGYEINDNGEVFGLLDSGSREQLGTIALASFPNLSGLKRAGDASFLAEDQAGQMNDGVPGTAEFGKLRTKALERSTVDIADQFVNLVVYQRGYQASSQALNAANELLRDTLALMR